MIVIEDQTIQLFPGTYNEYLHPAKEESSHEQKLLVLETRISEVLSKLSIEPTEELEQEFQALLREKKQQTDNWIDYGDWRQIQSPFFLDKTLKLFYHLSNYLNT